MVPKLDKNHLYVVLQDEWVDATLHSHTVPADSMGPAHQKHAYHLSNGMQLAFGWTKREALDVLLTAAGERGWRVLQPLN